MAKPKFNKTILVQENNNLDELIGYEFPDDIFNEVEDFEDGEYIAVYELKSVKRVEKKARLV